MNYKKLSKVLDAYNSGFLDPRTGKKLSRKELFEYDGPERKWTSVESYLKENPVYGVDYTWVHQDGTPLTEEEVDNLLVK